MDEPSARSSVKKKTAGEGSEASLCGCVSVCMCVCSSLLEIITISAIEIYVYVNEIERGLEMRKRK